MSTSPSHSRGESSDDTFTIQQRKDNGDVFAKMAIANTTKASKEGKYSYSFYLSYTFFLTKDAILVFF